MKLKVDVIRSQSGNYTVMVNGISTVSRESLALADRIAAHLRGDVSWDGSEAAEVADSIRKWFEANGKDKEDFRCKD